MNRFKKWSLETDIWEISRRGRDIHQFCEKFSDDQLQEMLNLLADMRYVTQRSRIEKMKCIRFVLDYRIERRRFAHLTDEQLKKQLTTAYETFPGLESFLDSEVWRVTPLIDYLELFPSKFSLSSESILELHRVLKELKIRNGQFQG